MEDSVGLSGNIEEVDLWKALRFRGRDTLKSDLKSVFNVLLAEILSQNVKDFDGMSGYGGLGGKLQTEKHIGIK